MGARWPRFLLVDAIVSVSYTHLDVYKRQKLEYVHGNEEFDRVTQEYDTLGFVMPAMEKATFFDELSEMGVFPKKCFSLGEANEKRYYIECRLLSEHEEEVLEEEDPEASELAQETEEQDVYKRQA